MEGCPQNFFLLFDLKKEHFGAVFKLNLTEEICFNLLSKNDNRIARGGSDSSGHSLILATPVHCSLLNGIKRLGFGLVWMCTAVCCYVPCVL